MVMGTRADFYVGLGEQAEWLGSVAWDGNPDNDVAAINQLEAFINQVEALSGNQIPEALIASVEAIIAVLTDEAAV